MTTGIEIMAWLAAAYGTALIGVAYAISQFARRAHVSRTGAVTVADTWPASEAARFHCIIACSITVLAALWPLGAVFVVHGWSSRVLLIVVTLGLMVAAFPLWARLRHTPADPHGALKGESS
ncbi:MAG TPA: hypothetical protein GXZ30_11170 [Propionibacterium sp.]|jgi:hypothetical protein|nr:hypothetical protein [Propionibacterium sp.]